MLRYNGWFLSILLLFVLSIDGYAEDTFSYFGDANKADGSAPRLDLKRIFVMPGKDDVNGALAPELDQAVLAYIDMNSRFELIRNREVVSALKMDERGYGRVANNQEVHSKAASITGADATIILESKHLGKEIQIRQDWRRSDGTLLFTESQSIRADSSITAQRELVSKMMKSVEARIPFAGSVTGVDGRTITLDLNKEYVSVGDRIDLIQLRRTKRHPLLKTLVDAEYKKIARAEITSVDPVLSFAKVISIAPGEQIDKTIKVARLNTNFVTDDRQYQPPPRQTRPQPKEDPFAVKEPETKDPLLRTEDDRLRLQNNSYIGRYGKAGVRLNLANIAYSQTVGGVSTDLSGWGLGAALYGEAWITKEWIIGLSYDFSNAGLSGERGNTAIEADGASWNQFQFYGGYRYLLEGSLEKMFLTFGLGYQSIGMNLPADTTNQLGSKTFSGILISLKIDYPLDERSWIVGTLGLSPFGSFDETGASLGTTDGSTSVTAALGYQIRWKKQFWLTVDLILDSSSASYTNGINLTDRRLSISPGLIYRF